MRSEYVAKIIRKYIGIIVLFLIVVVAFYLPRLRDKVELEINRAKWESQNITHYRFNLGINHHRFLLSDITPVTIEVQDDQIVSIVDANGVVLDQGFETVGTVERLFDRIQKGISETETVASVYDSKYGFPTSIYIIEVFEVTEEYTISNFEILP